MGTVLHHFLQVGIVGASWFQSPSRWGRCCIGTFGAGGKRPATRFSPLLDGDGVASMGTLEGITRKLSRFSPLLDGDGVASSAARPGHTWKSGFSPLLDGDGVASHLEGVTGASISGFSPLLDGDGVASWAASAHTVVDMEFQSPSRWGRCCIVTKIRSAALAIACFSPLLDGDGVASHPEDPGRPDRFRPFQSPSRWGRCCIELVGDEQRERLAFQSPSRWGRCCISGWWCL